MKIRAATPSDIPALIAFNGIAHDAHVKAFPDRFRREIPPQAIADFFAEKLKSPSSYYLVAEEDEPVGALRANFLDLEESWHSIARRVCYVAGIVVLPAYRHRGIARALFETLQREADARGATIELDVWEFNDEAKRVFAKLGFKPVMERMALNPNTLSATRDRRRSELDRRATRCPPFCAGRSARDHSLPQRDETVGYTESGGDAFRLPIKGAPASE